MDIIPTIALIAAKIEQAQEAQSEEDARMALKEIWDMCDRCLADGGEA